MSDISHVTVIGGGIMGTGLATHFATKEVETTLVDHKQANIDAARDRIAENVQFIQSEMNSKLSEEAVLENLSFTLNQSSGVANTDLVLETISENLTAKQEVFGEVAATVDDETILASNTSSIRITRIAESVPEVADRVIGCHWWNPPYLMPLVEVVKGKRTSSETVGRVTSFAESVDRNPIVVNKDVPGFVWNRIQFAVLRECMYLVEADVASLEDVNVAVRDGYALRTSVVGPFETVDLSGLDLYRTIAESLYPHLNDADEPSDLFDVYLNNGRCGIEEGAGFFEYDQSAAEIISERDKTISDLCKIFESR